MAQTLTEKIAERHASGSARDGSVRSGDVLRVRPAHVMTHDNTGAVIPKFRALGATRVADPRQPVITLDHDVQNRSEANLAKYARIEAFAAEQGIAFHPAGRGIGHQVMCEEGFVLPGRMVVASDSHSNLYGGLGALGTPVVRSDAAAIWATGETWYRVPPVTRVVLNGALRDGATGKDLILALCGDVRDDEVLNHAVEFVGPGVATLTIDERLTVANMTTEWGALAGVFPCDERTIAWLERVAERLAHGGAVERDVDRDVNERALAALRAELAAGSLAADDDARYARTIHVDLAAVRPFVSGPNGVKLTTPLERFEAEPVAIHKAYLLSCVNGRADDLSAAARVLDGRRVADGVELYVAAASSLVEDELRARGDWQRLEAAGARFLPAGCGPCIGLGVGLLEDGEVGISATNRNFAGRMGSRAACCYLASPQVVAASAIAGRITGTALDDSGPFVRVEPREDRTAPRDVALCDGFPRVVEGPIVRVPADDLNTDGIYAKDWTYRDDLGPAEQASHAMENHDPDFARVARAGDVLVAGRNFGCGSSREQAATCLLHYGLACVVAASFSDTYLRNAFNNGLLCFESPALHDWLRERDPVGARTYRPGATVRIDVARSVATVDGREFHVAPVGAVAQELCVAGGLEPIVRRRLADAR